MNLAFAMNNFHGNAGDGWSDVVKSESEFIKGNKRERKRERRER
jgi:hypothetical protein